MLDWSAYETAVNAAAERHHAGPLAGATVVVLGASGLLGQALLRILIRCRAGRVVAVARGAGLQLPGIEVVPGSTTDTGLYARLPRPDYVAYVAGTTSDALARGRETVETHVDGLLHATDHAADCRGFVFASSMRVYGPYVDDVTIEEETRLVTDVMSSGAIFEASKRLAEGWIAHSAEAGTLAGTVVRLANIYGPFASRPRASFVGGIVDEALRTGTVLLRGHPESTRNYCFSVDAADGVLLAMTRGRPGTAYNIGSSENLSNLDFVSAVARLVDPTIEVEVPETALRQPRSKTVVSIDRARRELGFDPQTRLDAALPLTVAWTRAMIAGRG